MTEPHDQHPHPDRPQADHPHPDHPHPDPPHPIDHDTPAAPREGQPSKHHGDPLLAASKGAQEGTEGSRHGHHDPQDG